jgi:hypothetical protein
MKITVFALVLVCLAAVSAGTEEWIDTCDQSSPSPVKKAALIDMWGYVYDLKIESGNRLQGYIDVNDAGCGCWGAEGYFEKIGNGIYAFLIHGENPDFGNNPCVEWADWCGVLYVKQKFGEGILKISGYDCELDQNFTLRPARPTNCEPGPSTPPQCWTMETCLDEEGEGNDCGMGLRLPVSTIDASP